MAWLLMRQDGITRMQHRITYLDVNTIGILDVKAQYIVSKSQSLCLEEGSQSILIVITYAKHDVINLRLACWSQHKGCAIRTTILETKYRYILRFNKNPQTKHLCVPSNRPIHIGDID